MQSFIDIQSTEPLITSRAKLTDNDKTIMSCNSGTVFPTTNLQVGMLCLRTDQNCLYQLKNTTPTWVMIADLDTKPILADGSVPMTANLNLGGYDITSSAVIDILNGGSAQGINVGTIVVSDAYADRTGNAQANGIYAKGAIKTANQLISSIATGTAPLAITSTTKVANLNVDMIEGYHAGNATGQIPVSNGTVNTNLNADKLDGYEFADIDANAFLYSLIF